MQVKDSQRLRSVKAPTSSQSTYRSTNPTRIAPSSPDSLSMVNGQSKVKHSGVSPQGWEISVPKDDALETLKDSLPADLACLSAVFQLPETVLLTLLGRAQISEYRLKEPILRSEEELRYIYLVLDGVVSVHAHTKDNRHIINDYLGRGRFFGEAALADLPGTGFWVNARGNCSVAAIDKDDFARITERYPEVLRVIMRQLAHQMYNANLKIRDIAFLDVSDRVANALQKLAHGPSAITHPDGMQIRITRQELGLVVGCSREMVGRAIKALHKQGLIEVSGKNIVILGAR